VQNTEFIAPNVHSDQKLIPSCPAFECTIATLLSHHYRHMCLLISRRNAEYR